MNCEREENKGSVLILSHWGKELFLDYGYDLKYNVPRWYLALDEATFGKRQENKRRMRGRHV